MAEVSSNKNDSDCADGSELKGVLSRRQQINDGERAPENKVKVRIKTEKIIFNLRFDQRCLNTSKIR